MNDPHLEMLVRLADQRDWQTGVTLAVGGALVSGLIVSGPRYMRELEEQLADAPGKSDPSSIQTFIKGIREARVTLEAEELRDPDEDPPEIDMDAEYDWITMIGTIIHIGSRTLEAGPWRGKLASVDGWHYGIHS